MQSYPVMVTWLLLSVPVYNNVGDGDIINYIYSAAYNDIKITSI